MLTKRHLILSVIIVVILPVILLAGIQLATRNESDTSQTQTGTPVSTVDKNSDGQPTKLAFAQAIAKGTAAKNDPATFAPSAEKVTNVDALPGGWYIIDLDVPGLNSRTTIALTKYDEPGMLSLKAGPGNYFYADWLKQDGVPDSVAAALIARNGSNND